MANILSLFDGIACGRVVLEGANLKADKYFASEINPHAIQVAKKNYPDIIHIGDVMKVRYKDGVLITESGKYKVKIDMIMGGSPCTGFSFAGKQLNFEDPQSKLFLEYARILQEVKPKYFLLENVKMKKEYQDVITKYLGVEPIEIDGALLTAQQRKRLYWTNIPNITQPEDKGIVLKDVITENMKQLKVVNSNYANYVTKEGKSRLKLLRKNYQKGDNGQVSVIINDTPSGISRQVDRLYSIHGKSPTLTCVGANSIKCDNGTSDYNEWFILSPVTCERLQGLPDSYTKGIPTNQRYKCLGNGWNVPTIVHILNHIPRKRKDDTN